MSVRNPPENSISPRLSLSLRFEIALDHLRSKFNRRPEGQFVPRQGCSFSEQPSVCQRRFFRRWGTDNLSGRPQRLNFQR